MKAGNSTEMIFFLAAHEVIRTSPPVSQILAIAKRANLRG